MDRNHPGRPGVAGFRWRQGIRAGRWHPTRAEAISAAVKAGVASRDEYDSKRIWWHIFTEIEERKD